MRRFGKYSRGACASVELHSDGGIVLLVREASGYLLERNG